MDKFGARDIGKGARDGFAWSVVMLMAIGVFYVLREHWGHLLGWWPYLLLLACPLMHVLHGSRHRHRADVDATEHR